MQRPGWTWWTACKRWPFCSPGGAIQKWSGPHIWRFPVSHKASKISLTRFMLFIKAIMKVRTHLKCVLCNNCNCSKWPPSITLCWSTALGWKTGKTMKYIFCLWFLAVNYCTLIWFERCFDTTHIPGQLRLMPSFRRKYCLHLPWLQNCVTRKVSQWYDDCSKAYQNCGWKMQKWH